MLKKLIIAAAVASCGVFGAPFTAAALDNAGVVKSVDKDNDGTIDLGEARTAAMAHFEKLDSDHDGTVDKSEAKADEVSASAFTAADPDKDGTVDKKEFAALLDKAFKRADSDNDGTVSAEELTASSGKGLLSMIR